MAWNESGGGEKDPWGNRGDQGPPDLDEAIRKLQGRAIRLIRRWQRRSTGGGGGRGISAGSISLLLIVLGWSLCVQRCLPSGRTGTWRSLSLR